MEERVIFVESSDLVDGYPFSLLEESSENHVPCVNKQRVITIDSSSDNSTVELYSVSSHPECTSDSGLGRANSDSQPTQNEEMQLVHDNSEASSFTGSDYSGDDYNDISSYEENISYDGSSFDSIYSS